MLHLSPVARWALAAGVLALAIASNVLVQAAIGGRAPFMAFFPAVIVIALLAGRGPAVVALAVSAAAVARWWIAPVGEWWPERPGDLLAVGLFGVAGGAAIAVALVARRLLLRQSRDRDDLERTRARLDAAHAAANMVEWEWDVRTGRVVLSRSAERVFGARWDTLEASLPLAVEEDRERVERTIREAVAAGRDYSFVSRMRRPDTGEVRWLETRAVVHRGADGVVSHVTGVSLDVTERQEALEALRESEQRFRVALAGGSVIVWACDAARRYTWVHNPGAGLRSEDFIGREIGSVLPAARYPEFTAAVENAWQTGQPQRLPVTLGHAGDTRHYLVNIEPVLDAAGKVAGLVGASIDVTDLQRARHAAQDARTELQAIVNSMASGVSRLDRDGCYLWASRRYLEIVGYEGESVVGRRVADVVGPALYAVKRPWIERVLAGETVEFEQAIEPTPGRRRWVHAAYTPTRDVEGAVDGWVAVVGDRTERHRVDEALRESEERLRLALDGARIGMWETELATGLTHCTPLNYELFGLPPDSGPVTAEGWRTLILAEDVPVMERAWRQAFAGGTHYAAEYRVQLPDGRVRWMQSRGSFRDVVHGTPTRIVGITQDVTERRESEEALREASRRKDEFLATLAHELRNPMAPIRYAAALLRRNADPATLERARTLIERQSAQMTRLLDDLLDMSRVTRGAIELRRAPLDLRELVEHAIDTARPAIAAQGHRLVTSMPPRRLAVDGDAARLLQVVGNLLDNAIKYTPPEGRLEVELAELAGRGGQALLHVRDSGLGLAPEMLPRVFELFAQVHKGHGASSSGLGIGLAVVKRLVELHGGRIEVTSAGLGRGACFTVALPLAPAGAAVATAGGEKVVPLHADRPRVLVVDDNVDAADSLAAVLRVHGCPVHVAYAGHSALALADEVRPDVVVLDLGLPDVPGLEIARELRARAWAARLRILAVTGWGQEEDRRRTREVGIDLHFVKPVDPDVLYAALRDAGPAAGVGPATAAPAVGAGPTTAPPEPSGAVVAEAPAAAGRPPSA